MVTALQPNHRMLPAPTKVDDGPALVEEYGFTASGTYYRVLVVDLGDRQRLVLAEPAGLRGARRYLPLNDNDGELAQEYIGEKLGFDDYRSEDCMNLTLLIAYALDRPALVINPLRPDAGYERRDPR